MRKDILLEMDGKPGVSSATDRGFLSLFFVPFTDSGNTPKKAQIHRHKMNPMDKTKIWQRDFCDPSSPLRAMGIV